jgi:hypothetical protein
VDYPRKVRAGWVEFLKRFNWSLFCTLTFKYPVKTMWGAEHLVREFAERTTKHELNSISYCFFLETFHSGDWHCHGLIRNLNEFHRSSASVWAYWKATNGGRCQFSELRGTGEAFGYMVKYLTKSENRCILDLRG